MLRDKLKPLLRRVLSPPAFDLIRMLEWHASFYFPRLVASWFVRRRPQVHSFGNPSDAESLVKQLEKVNAAAPTRMCRVMTRHGTDKANRWHNYTSVYSALLREFHGRACRIFELGLGTNNTEVPFSMGVFGRPGASLRGWRLGPLPRR